MKKKPLGSLRLFSQNRALNNIGFGRQHRLGLRQNIGLDHRRFIALADSIKAFDFLSKKWHNSRPYKGNNFILRLHYNNFLQWHQEDVSRNPTSTDGHVAQSKKNIDRLNAMRNRLTERIDELMYGYLPRRDKRLPWNSESPASIIDRLSVLSLRIYHIGLPMKYGGIFQKNKKLLIKQRDGLLWSFKGLIDDLLTGEKQLKVHRHYKVYCRESI